MNRAIICVLTAVSLTAAAGASQPVNPSFESWAGGLCSGWQVTGTFTASYAAPAAPTDGAVSALLTSGNTPAVQVALFLNATMADINGPFIAHPARDGSAIKQSITVNQGDVIAFDFKFNNGETANNVDWPDCGFVVVNGSVTLLGTSANLPHGWTPLKTHFIMNPPTGTVELAFAVFNFADFAVDSQLMIDNVRVGPAHGPCGGADVGSQGGTHGPDARLDNNDFVVFIEAFFAQLPIADRGGQGGLPTPDGDFNNNDFIVFIDQFFAAQGQASCGI